MSFEIDKEKDLADRGIAWWNAERPEIDTSGKAITGRLMRLGEMAGNRMNAVSSQFGVKYPTYAILATLRASGPPYAMTPKSLQATLLVSSGGLSNQLARIEKQGFIRRVEDPSDGRGVRVELTGAGMALTEEAMPAQAEAELDFIRMLTKEERETLVQLLRKVLVVNSIRSV
ncbi:MarR family winged helix-turn-helix transcriptional regulator [Seohaeicola zhoushanensis]|uniref:MarR family transcriptional regulator n=1 Tax=Seohaeicola zhoushanensis TaxID=1569283 RepID=A0A8J3M4M2_9RHOB|nr:MarR family transcriptional regulator [Seohaeicola zhoushanensis]GHF39305.1 MarR family transcriptional regulator [Seohaeicola zhoushanensis]